MFALKCEGHFLKFSDGGNVVIACHAEHGCLLLLRDVIDIPLRLEPTSLKFSDGGNVVIACHAEHSCILLLRDVIDIPLRLEPTTDLWKPK